MRTADLMRGRWHDALKYAGMTDRELSGKHCPCPMCGGKDRFRFDDKDGTGSYFCAGCGAGDGMKLMMRLTGRDFREVAAELDKAYGNYSVQQPERRDTGELLRRIGAGLLPVGDISPVVNYLRSRAIRRIPREFLRYHPAAWHSQECRTLPAMVAALRDVDGKCHGYHMTYLSERGEKASIEAPRLYSPGQTGECAIRLTPVTAHIGLAEGIETALSVTELFGLPCWATGDAGRMERFKVPAGVERVTVFADVDQNYTGEAAAFSLAKRLSLQGITCDVRHDCPRGTDYNDLLLRGIRETA